MKTFIKSFLFHFGIITAVFVAVVGPPCAIGMGFEKWFGSSWGIVGLGLTVLTQISAFLSWIEYKEKKLNDYENNKEI